MLINEFFMDYEGKSLIQKILGDIIAYKANWIFADKVIKILVDRNPNYRDDPNLKCQVDGFRANRDTAFEGGYRLRKLFESEFISLDSYEDEIKETANSFADIALRKFRWIKEKEDE